MTRKTMLSVTGLLLAVALLPVFAASDAGTQAYKIDPVHSSAMFRIKHLNTSFFWGRFNDISGTVAWGPTNPEASLFDVRIKTESVDSKNPKRDAHLKSPDFFNAKQFPMLSFKSTSIKKTGEDAYDVSGDLTLHGVTKAITVKVEHTGSGKNMLGGPIVGFETTFNIKRSDFGMKFMPDALGDDIRIIVSLEADRG